MNILRTLFLALTACSLTASAAGLDTGKVVVFGESDRNPLTYQPGDPMHFTIRADFGGQQTDAPYFLEWTRNGDDGKNESGKAPAGEPLRVTTALAQPGFVRIYVRVVDQHGKPLPTRNSWGQAMDCSFEGGAAVLPEQLKSAPAPADFAAFWDRQKAILAQVPLKSERKKHSGSTREVDIYAVRVDCAGARSVTGYLTIPTDAAARSLPARAVYSGYGVTRPGLPWDLRRDRIEFHVNAHGFELDQTDDYYRQFEDSIRSNGHGYAFDPVQNAKPETAYFNGMAMRVMRSLEFLRSLPQWNGKDLEVSGGSQGGLQSIWAAALDSNVTACYADIPWGCDIEGATRFRRMRGWLPEYRPALAYYDAVNHAPGIRCPVEIPRAGLGDYTCAPSGVAVLYNNLQCPKKIVWVQGSTHGYVPPQPKQYIFQSDIKRGNRK